MERRQAKCRLAAVIEFLAEAIDFPRLHVLALVSQLHRFGIRSFHFVKKILIDFTAVDLLQSHSSNHLVRCRAHLDLRRSLTSQL